MFVISERQEGLHASLNFSGSKTAFHGEEEQSTKSFSSTGTQQYTGCSVMADNWGKSSLCGLMEYALSKMEGQNNPIPSTPKHYAGSTLVEYAISKAAGHNTAETSSAEPLAGLSLMEYAISKAGKQKESLTSGPREKIWSCNIHNKHYLNSFQYKTHLKQVHQGNYKCPSCGKSYVNKYGLDQHVRTVHLGKGLICPIPTCVKQFTSHRGCDLHASKHSEPEKFRCDNCSYVCQDKDSLSPSRHQEGTHAATAQNILAGLMTAKDMNLGVLQLWKVVPNPIFQT